MTAEPMVPISRRERKKELTRREIYEAAMGLFSAKRFVDVTISEICETADVGRGTFFLHFPTKAALLYEFNERITRNFRSALEDEQRTAREDLETLVERIGIKLAAQSEIMTAMLAAFFSSPETIAVAPNCGGALGKSHRGDH